MNRNASAERKNPNWAGISHEQRVVRVEGAGQARYECAEGESHELHAHHVDAHRLRGDFVGVDSDHGAANARVAKPP